MITIKDIAKEAEVSEGTVDRVIHNRGGVSKKTEARIRKLLDFHNFIVNPVASALAKKNKHSIAALIPNYNASDLFWKSPYLGILKASEDVKNLGVELTTFSFEQSNQISYLETFNTLLESKPTAVIMVPNFSKQTKQIVSKLERFNIPYLFLNIDIENFNNIAFVGQDSYTAGYMAGKLIKLCLPQTGSFLIIQAKKNSIKNNAISDRIQGFNDYLSKNNNDSKIHVLKLENLNKTSKIEETINSYLEKYNDIKGIFVPSSRIHIIVNSIKAKHLKKIKLIGFDNTPQNIECLKNDSVSFLISQKPFDQGYESVKLMTDYLIFKKRRPNNKLYLPIDILIKENVDYNESKEFIFESEKSNLTTFL